MRKLSENFVKKLNGDWKPLLDYILSDSELDLQIRDNYINVYYQGGNILKINPNSFHIDEAYFKYSKTKEGFSLLSPKEINPEKVKHYFSTTKCIMNEWYEKAKKKKSTEERREQQQIALANRKDTDYVVLDLEYAVSRRSKFAYNGKLNKKVPRFDIITIHNGQLVVIELKKGMDATGGLSGVKPHIDCFNHTIGSDVNDLFPQEMKDLLKQKQDLGILDNSLKINDTKPKFIFAFADKNEEDKYIEFSCCCFKEGYKGDLIYLNSSHKLNRAMSREYYYSERKKQLQYYDRNLREIVQNKGNFDGKKRDFVLQNGKDNLLGKIQDDCLKYFQQEKILWWGENKSKHLPSGHLVSSQIHCLNHLFALRKDDAAVKAIIENATGLKIKEVYSSPLDKDGGYISFEFVCKNKTLLEEDYETRGANCTSIDALVYVQTIDNQNILIPIEWKYTETYQGKEATDKSLKRYPKLIDSKSNLKKWYDLYKADPYYELMRQTLLIEQIINKNEISEIEAVDFRHIMVVPNAHTELKNAIEEKYIHTLKDRSKFRIIDPEDFLSPLKDNSKYEELLHYLQTRYWKAL